MAGTPKNIDWELAEREYRAGIMTLREIGKAAGCSHVIITKRASTHLWERDLKAKIQAQTEAIVNKQAAIVNNSVTRREDLVTEGEIVTANANLQAGVLISQRGDIQRGRAITSKLYSELAVCGEDLLKRAQINKMLIEAMKSLVALERQAFGIAETATEDPEAAKPKMSDNETARRIAFVLAQQINVQVNK